MPRVRPRPSATPIRQLVCAEEIEAAIESGTDVRLVLVLEGSEDSAARRIVRAAAARRIRVEPVSQRTLARLSLRDPPSCALALVGRDPRADLDAMLARRGAVWLLTGVAYPGNVGMVIRTAEVSGAQGIVIDGVLDREARRAALRVSIRADRFMPVRWEPAARLLEAAARFDHRVVAIDEAGDRMPWEIDLRGPRILVVGGESGGIPPEVLARCHDRICVPMAGFIPCYNVQAAVSAVAVERLRQTLCEPSVEPRVNATATRQEST